MGLSPKLNLQEMTDAQLAQVYLKMAIPGYYSRSELQGLPTTAEFKPYWIEKMDKIRPLVRVQMDSYGHENKPAHSIVLDRMVSCLIPLLLKM